MKRFGFLACLDAPMSFLCSVPPDPLSVSEQALASWKNRFGSGPKPAIVSVPGRVNLIGEHIDYHDLPVLPVAIQRRVSIAFHPRQDERIRAVSSGYEEREFTLSGSADSSTAGDWSNYLKAAAQAARSRWPITRGIDAAIASDLPTAAGLSSSTALLTGFTIALLHANHICPSVCELMSILPDAEQFVGTRGGGMDHAIVLAAKAGCALLIEFAPLRMEPVPVPDGWSFLVAHSLTTAEKSGAVRAEYNARRSAGIQALQQLGLPSYLAALETDWQSFAAKLSGGAVRNAFLHVLSEAVRVRKAVEALRVNDYGEFGRLLIASHASLRDSLRVSTPALDALVETALEAGATGARLTGAGFGGCVAVLCQTSDRDQIREQLITRYYAGRAQFNPEKHLFFAEPSQGALADESL